MLYNVYKDRVVKMLENTYFVKLKEKYNYDDKVIKAIEKIIPCLIDYYGHEYKYIILEAILNTEIIACSSKQTISKVINEKKLTPLVGENLYDIDQKKGECVYTPNIKLSYNEEINSYEIDEIDRIIVTSHTFNYDSPKGIEVLTHALCHLVKSYKDEIMVHENKVTIRSGISYEERKIIYGENLSLELVNDFGKALEEGFTILDTEQIVSMVLNDKYKCYDYESLYMIALILKEKYKLKREINSFEMSGEITSFKKKYKKEQIDKLATICDDCVTIENDMHLSYTREDKDEIAKILKEKLEKEAFTELVSIYQNSKTKQKN